MTTNPAQPTPADASERKEILRTLSDLPLKLTALTTPEGQAPRFHIQGAYRSAIAQLDVYINGLKEARQLAEELPAHLLMPPVWNAIRPRKHKFAWAAGYIAAHKACLPKGKDFQTVFQSLRLACPYTDLDERHAFQNGVNNYLETVRQHTQTLKEHRDSIEITPTQTQQSQHKEAI